VFLLGSDEKKDILMSICWPWPDMIFSGRKPFEFRNHIGIHWAPGTKIFIYESKRCGGAGQVVGEAVIDEIIPIPQGSVGPPRFLLRYWAEHTPGRESLVPLLDELGDYELPGYKKGTILRYLSHPDLLRKAMQTGQWVFMIPGSDNPVEYCENWLALIGLIDGFGKYCYRYALKLKDIEKYEEPKPLAAYGITKAPQSWCYATEIHRA